MFFLTLSSEGSDDWNEESRWSTPFFSNATILLRRVITGRRSRVAVGLRKAVHLVDDTNNNGIGVRRTETIS